MLEQCNRNFSLKLLRILITYLANVYICGSNSISTLSTHLNENIAITNAFSDCIIHVIKFPGFDIDFQIVEQPIVILRYTSFSNEYFLYPYELDRVIGLNGSTGFVNQNQLQNTNSILLNNLSHSHSDIYKTGNINCEANIYINPPLQEASPFLNFEDQKLGTVLKDPFWINHRFDNTSNQWKNSNLNTVPKYSLLICEQSKNSICSSNNERSIWISTVLHHPDLVRLKETILVLVTSTSQSKLYIHCPYCDPCDQYKLKLIQTFNLMTSKWQLDKALFSDSVNQKSPYSIDVSKYGISNSLTT